MISWWLVHKHGDISHLSGMLSSQTSLVTAKREERAYGSTVICQSESVAKHEIQSSLGDFKAIPAFLSRTCGNCRPSLHVPVNGGEGGMLSPTCSVTVQHI